MVCVRLTLSPLLIVNVKVYVPALFAVKVIDDSFKDEVIVIPSFDDETFH